MPISRLGWSRWDRAMQALPGQKCAAFRHSAGGCWRLRQTPDHRLTAASKNKPERFISPRFENCVRHGDCAGSAGFRPQRGDRAAYIERRAHRGRLAPGHFKSPHCIAIIAAVAASGCQNLPARAAAAVHAGDIAAPAQLFHHLIGAAVEQDGPVHPRSPAATTYFGREAQRRLNKTPAPSFVCPPRAIAPRRRSYGWK